MTLADLEAALTGDRLMRLDTDARERPSQSEIAQLAYCFYEIRGRTDGHDVDDWLAAERELTHHYR